MGLFSTRQLALRLAGAVSLLVAGTTAMSAASAGAAITYGVGYDRYEPAFYTGFAPRIPEPDRLHLHIGRGNQLRVTAVLSDKALRDYAADVLARYRAYRDLIARGEVVPTQNRGFEAFEETVVEVGLREMVAEQASLSDGNLRARNLALLERLNPGQVFRVRMPIDELVRRWSARVAELGPESLDARRRVEAANLMLPTRMYLARLEPEDATALNALVARVRAADSSPGADVSLIRAGFTELLGRFTRDRYPLRRDALEFFEFTAIYPIGSFNQYTQYRGQRIPMYPTPGRRALTTHQRTKMVDHIPTNLAYSYSPWLPYMHVGARLHNSFHTLWWSMRPEEAAFLPEDLRTTRVNRDGKPHRFLWLLSRGPMSNGCTHVNVGHITELRQMLPADAASMSEVEVFINKSHLFDVFDIDGDLEPEVMGVRYFVAYSLRNKKPHRMRASHEREAYYEWLYGGALELDEAGRGYFLDAMDARFISDEAVNGRRYARLPLYEADYQPETVQFFERESIPFVRELRKVGVHRPFRE